MSETEEKTAPTTNIDPRCPSVDMMHPAAECLVLLMST